jgi:hypothetical protein
MGIFSELRSFTSTTLEKANYFPTRNEASLNGRVVLDLLIHDHIRESRSSHQQS